ncbi:MAG: hypothetical protein K1X28_10685 [Parachlamydiales bacterium]|nr:hypothetical protein [Parachlamydiales bacterium]
MIAILSAFIAIAGEPSAEVLHDIEAKMEGKGAIFLMRHGEQEKSDAVLQMESAAEQKIAMMRTYENRSASITKTSRQELVGVLTAFSFLQHQTNLPVSIESSENLRAYEPAQTLSAHLQTPLQTRAIWNCINYLDSFSDAELLNILPDGTVPWNREKIDLVAGPMTYDRITESVCKELTPGSEIRIIITHTQQIQAACQKLGLPQIRLDHYGFVLILENGTVFFYPNGFYKKV